jgi:hypothetical protein
VQCTFVVSVDHHLRDFVFNAKVEDARSKVKRLLAVRTSSSLDSLKLKIFFVDLYTTLKHTKAKLLSNQSSVMIAQRFLRKLEILISFCKSKSAVNDFKFAMLIYIQK